MLENARVYILTITVTSSEQFWLENPLFVILADGENMFPLHLNEDIVPDCTVKIMTNIHVTSFLFLYSSVFDKLHFWYAF